MQKPRVKNNKSINFIVSNDIYPFDIMFSLGETEEKLKAACKKFNVYIDKTLINHPVKYGQCIEFENGQQLIILKNFPDTPVGISHLIHEIDHARNNIMRYIGARPSVDSEECYAYFLDYIVEKVFDKLKYKLK